MYVYICVLSCLLALCGCYLLLVARVSGNRLYDYIFVVFLLLWQLQWHSCAATSRDKMLSLYKIAH